MFRTRYIVSFCLLLAACSGGAPDHNAEAPIEAGDSMRYVHKPQHVFPPEPDAVPAYPEPESRITSEDRINIAICGVDSRMGERTRHADANHVLSIMPDKGRIEIFSVPRDTPADAGFIDTMEKFNLLTNVRAHRGVRAYKRELARITELDTVHHIVEIGFSQAMGLLELLGYKRPESALRVLRTRKGLRGADFQRTFNQGQFIAQTIKRNFKRLDGFWGDMLLSGAMALVDNDLGSDKASNIIERLAKSGFGDSAVVVVELRPRYRHSFMVVDYDDPATLDSIHRAIARRYDSHNSDSTSQEHNKHVDSLVAGLLENARADSARGAYKVIQRLVEPFRQRIWLQVRNTSRRLEYRNRMAAMLTRAYQRLGNAEQVNAIREIIRVDDELFYSGAGSSARGNP